ncbi:MAG: redoxin domain-containing protein [Halieaceae bacterium]|nr:redoxin domain-containing protein [Halieaceae bacterium]
MRDAHTKFEAHGIKLYAVSYDDQETLQEFAREQDIPYPLLSDIDSRVIEQYGILNTEVSRDDAFLYGIPFPGVYVCDESGEVVATFFHDSYKKRDSAESLIDAALGRTLIDDDAPQADGGDGEIRITAAVQGGKASIRQGILRKLIVRFDLGEGLHIYSDPVPKGMVATQVEVSGPPGFTTLPMETPATEKLRLESMGVDLQVWSNTVDIVVPFYARGELASETRPLDSDTIDIEVKVRYQACTDNECLLPATEAFAFTLKMDVIDVPNLGFHKGHGQREGRFDSTPAMRRLIWRKVKKNPLGLLKFLWKNIKLELGARKRAKQQNSH